MNAQQDQIKTLIGEIDAVLSKPSPRLPWVASVETAQQRQVLERVRSYLISLEQKLNSLFPSSSNAENETRLGTAIDRSRTPATSQSADFNSLPRQGEVAQQIMQAVIEEMSYLRASLTQPIQEDILALRQEQQTLVSELKQLELRRQQHYSLAQQQANQQQIISEFLQALMVRLHESLARDVSQTLANLEARFLLNHPLLGTANAAESLPGDRVVIDELASQESSATEEPPVLTPAQRLEQMRQLQAQSDRLLMTLDSTLSVVFEALHRNLQGHEESLSQGLEKMHNLGQQGEVMFTALVNHLAEQLGREAFSYVNRHLETLETTPRSPEGSTSLERQEPQAESSTLQDTEDYLPQDKLPYPGTEVSAARLAERKKARTDLNRRQTATASEALGKEATPPGDRPEPAIADQRELATPPQSEWEEAASPFPSSEEAEGELEELYDSLFSSATTASTPFAEREAEAVSSTAPPIAPKSPLTTSESEPLEEFIVAEDSEFMVSDALDELSLKTQELFGAIATPSEINQGTSQGTLADLSEAFEEETSPTSASAIAPNAEVGVAPQTDSELLEWMEDGYEQASPEENLLPAQEPIGESDAVLSLDNNALQQLQADLYSLEGLEFSEIEENYEPFNAGSEAAFNLELSSEDNPFVVSTEEEITTFEDLFADFSEAPPLAPASPAVEVEREASLFPDRESEADDFNMTLDDILASLTEEENRSTSSQSHQNVRRSVDTTSTEKKKDRLFP